MEKIKQKVYDELEKVKKEIEEIKTFTWYDRDINKLKKDWYKLHERKRILNRLLED